MIDYSEFTDAELSECLEGIDREKFPDNYEALTKEIKARSAADCAGSKKGGVSSASVKNEPSLYPQEIRESVFGEDTKNHNYVLWAVLSVVLFAAAASNLDGLRYTLLIIPAIFVHELGHYFAMRMFGYENVSIFFIPFFGAITKGKMSSLNRENEAIVSLSGPLLGILVAVIAMLVTKYVGKSRVLVDFSYYSFVLNMLNLIPIIPFDGGRFWDSLLTSRNVKVAIFFNAVSAIAALLIAVKLKMYVMGVVVALLLIKLKEMIVAQGVVAKLPQFVNRDVMSDEFIAAVIKGFQSVAPNTGKAREITKNRTVALIRDMDSKSATMAFSFLGAVAYFFVVAVAFVLLAIVMVAKQRMR
jgi:Zn-dependent protease